MINFNFQNPAKIIFGKGQIAKVAQEIKAFKARNVLIVAGGGSIKKNGIYEAVVSSLKDSGISWKEIWGIKPNPRLDKVREGAEICKQENIDFILAIGGGSVIDTAKGIGVAAVNDRDVWDFYMGLSNDIPHCLPIGVVLTIPAAGSETSYASVITNTDGDFKRGIHNNIIIPKFAILDPETTYSLPPYQTACGASDILAHLMERYFTNVDHVDLTDRLIEGACMSIIRNSLIALENPRDYNARAEIMFTGTIAHNNLLDSGRIGDWGSHNIEHELSGTYDIAHGAGLSIIFPAWMKYVWHVNPQKFMQFGERVWGVASDPEHPEIAIASMIARLESWYKQLNLPTRLSEIGIDDSNFESMAERALVNRENGLGNLMKLNKQDIINIYNLALK